VAVTNDRRRNNGEGKLKERKQQFGRGRMRFKMAPRGEAAEKRQKGVKLRFHAINHRDYGRRSFGPFM
jgi:hypothetical protein